MTIMQAVLYPPLDDEEDYDNQHPTISNNSSSNNSCNNTAGVVPNLMSPELQARFETLKRLRDENNLCHETNNDDDDDKDDDERERGKDSPSNRRRLELATETALAAKAEIARMHQAVAELEGLLHDNERNNNLGDDEEEDESGNDEEEELIDDDEEADYCPPGKPVAMISFPRLPQVVVFDEDPHASDQTYHDIMGEKGETHL